MKFPDRRLIQDGVAAMACVLTLDNGKEVYTLTGEKGYVGCAIFPKLWRMSSIFLLDCPAHAYAALRVRSADLDLDI